MRRSEHPMKPPVCKVKRRTILDELGDPDFINDEGVKWWLSFDLTKYAREANINGTKLDEVSVWLTELLNGAKSYVVVERGEAIFDTTTFEGAAAHVDIMKLSLEADALDD